MFDDLENKKDRYFHVTPRKNLSAIQKEGLLAQIGDRSQEAKEEAEAVFLFPSKEDMDNALLNWLGEAFEEEDTEAEAVAVSEEEAPVEPEEEKAEKSPEK